MDLNALQLPEDLRTPIVTCTIEGILEESDLRELALSKGEAAPADREPEEEFDASHNLKRIKEKHHSVARMLVSGLPQGMVAKLCGYDESYMSVLLNSPAMIELVEMYRIKKGAAIEVITEKLKVVGLKALEKVEEKIDADELNNLELLSAAKLGFDRSGHGPSSTHHNINEEHIVDWAEITRRNKEAQQRSAPYVVSASEVRKAIEPPKEQIDETSGNLGKKTSQLHEDREQLRSPDEGKGE